MSLQERDHCAPEHLVGSEHLEAKGFQRRTCKGQIQAASSWPITDIFKNSFLKITPGTGGGGGATGRSGVSLANAGPEFHSRG